MAKTMRVEVPDSPAGPFTMLGRLGTPCVADHNAVPVWAGLFKETTLSVREREAFRHRMAHLVGCEYCAGLRSAALTVSQTDDAVPEEFYDNIFNLEWEGYTQRERLIVETIERFAEDHESLRDDDDFWARMHESFSETEIVDVCYHMVGPQLGRVLMAKVLLGYSELCEVQPESAARAAQRLAQLELSEAAAT
jgi:alkylhydroperoxidase family enzyme